MPYTNCSDLDDEESRLAGVITVEFTAPIFLHSINFLDIELAENGVTDNNRISLFGPLNRLINNNFFTPFTGNRKWDRVSFNTSGVTKIEINMGGSGAVDDIVFSVSEPGALIIFGFGLVGLALARRRRAD